MSGSGRKSQYRKSVATTFLDDSRTPEPTEKIVVVLGNRGDNTFEIRMESGEKGLARLPKKFNKMIWIKSGDNIIIEDDRLVATEEKDNEAETVVASESTESAAQFTIKHILSKPNIKFLKLKNLWPVGLDATEFTEATPTSNNKVVQNRSDDIMPYDEEEEGEEGEYEEEEEVMYDSKGNTIEKEDA